jgi:hypothetical protein
MAVGVGRTRLGPTPLLNFYDTAAGQGFGTNPNGGLFGGHIGINAQVGQWWIIGAEVTGDWANLQQTLLGPVTPVFPLDSYKTQLNDLETTFPVTINSGTFGIQTLVGRLSYKF